MHGSLRMGTACEDTQVPHNAHQRTSSAEMKMFFPDLWMEMDAIFSRTTYFYSSESKYKVSRVARIEAIHRFKLVVFPSNGYCHS